MSLYSYFRTCLLLFGWAFPFMAFVGGYYLCGRLFPPSTFPAPVLTGLSLDQAVRTASHCGCGVRVIAVHERDDLAAGTVIQQKPAPLTPVRPFQTVLVIVSQVSEKQAVPDSIGKPGASVEELFKSCGYATRTYGVPSHYPQGRVCAQSPSPGFCSDNGIATLYVAAEEKDLLIMPSLQGLSVAEVEAWAREEGIQLQCARPPAEETRFMRRVARPCHVVEQRPLAGSLIEKVAGLAVYCACEES